MLLIPCACSLHCLNSRLWDKGGYHSSASLHFSDFFFLSVSSLGLWLPFLLDRISAVYSVWGREGGGCAATAVSRAPRPRESDVCWQYGVSAGWCGRLHQPEYSWDILHPRQRNNLPVFCRASWQELHIVRASVDSPRHIVMPRLSAPVLWNRLQSLVSQNWSADYFCTHSRSWNSNDLIGSYCDVAISSWKTPVVKQFRKEKKFSGFYAY